MNREELEAEAQANVCPCYAYDLPNGIEHMEDSELQAIIADGMACHYENQKYNPVPEDEHQEELRQCPDYVGQAA